MDTASEVLVKFDSRFHSPAKVYRAPGRVNLIGEHTDYNDGFVLPAAIGFFCWAAIAPREDRRLVVYSENFNESVEADLDNLRVPATNSWADYALGVAWALEQAGHRLRGANLYISGEVPLGAGLSSSAAVEVATGFGLVDMARHPIDLKQLAFLCQKAENEFVGARCGIMDQFVSCHGSPGSALLLDCRSLDFQLVRLPSEIRLVICNTMVQHKLGTTEYNARRTECEEGVRRLSKVCPDVHALRDVSLADLENNRNILGDLLYKRCHHVVSENARTLATASALRAGEIATLRQLMADSHRSLREEYEVSCPELDTMVDIAMQHPGVFGARMTGGGFGGCTINLVSVEQSSSFCESIAEKYEAATGYHPDIYVCEASQGAEMVEARETKTGVDRERAMRTE